MRQWLSPSPSDAPASTGNARDSLPRLMRLDIRWEASDGEHARKMAAELVALSPDVILSSGVTGLTALQKIHHIPVVFAVAPIRSAPGLSTAWRGQEAMSPVSCSILRRQF